MCCGRLRVKLFGSWFPSTNSNGSLRVVWPTNDVSFHQVNTHTNNWLVFFTKDLLGMKRETFTRVVNHVDLLKIPDSLVIITQTRNRSRENRCVWGEEIRNRPRKNRNFFLGGINEFFVFIYFLPFFFWLTNCSRRPHGRIFFLSLVSNESDTTDVKPIIHTKKSVKRNIHFLSPENSISLFKRDFRGFYDY